MDPDSATDRPRRARSASNASNCTPAPLRKRSELTASTAREAKQSCATFARAATHAASIGLGVNAGHDLDLVNLPLFRQITEVQEVSIGHALIGDALRIGLAAAVAAYIGVLKP